jgi:hypothetical protein
MPLPRSGALAAAALIGFMSLEPASAAEPIFHTRSYNAFTQIFGRPEFFAGSMLSKGTTKARSTVNIVSFAERDHNTTEQFELDGEAYHLDWHLDHTLTDRWEIGARIPLLRYTGGYFDSAVDNFHDLIHAPSGNRNEQPRDELRLFYQADNTPFYDLQDSSQGLGDVQLRTRYLLSQPSSHSRQLALHGGVKLATGDEDKLHGSGAADYSIGVGISDPVTFRRQRLTLSAHAGVLFLGDGDVLSDLQEDTVPFAGMQLSFAVTDRLALLAGIQGAGPYYDTDLDALGGTTVQLSFGANIDFPTSGWQWRLGIVEDGLSDVMPDFALHMEISKRFGHAAQ